MNVLRLDLRIPQFMPPGRKRFKWQDEKWLALSKVPGRRKPVWREFNRHAFALQIWNFCDARSLGVTHLEAEAIMEELQKEGAK